MDRGQGVEAPIYGVTCVGEESIDQIKDPKQKKLTITDECDLLSSSGAGQVVNGMAMEDNTITSADLIVCGPASDTRSGPVGSPEMISSSSSNNNPSGSNSSTDSVNDDLVTASDSRISRAAEASHGAYGTRQNESPQDFIIEPPIFSPQDVSEEPSAFDKYDEEEGRSTEVCMSVIGGELPSNIFCAVCNFQQLFREANPVARL